MIFCSNLRKLKWEFEKIILLIKQCFKEKKLLIKLIVKVIIQYLN